MLDTIATDITADNGGRSQQLAISTTSARSTAVNANTCLVHATTACFFRQGRSAPTALSDGTDMFLPANVTFRVSMVKGDMLAFKTATGTGTVYITPEV